MRPKFYINLGLIIVSISALLFLNQNCGGEDASLLTEEIPGDQFFEVAIASPVHRDVEALYQSVRQQKPIQLSVLQLIPQIVDDVSYSGVVALESLNQGSVVQGTREPGKPNTDKYAALEFGGTVFVFRVLEKSNTAMIFDSVPSTFLLDRPLKERVVQFLEARYYERDRIQRLTAQIDGIDFLARLVPGVDGLDRTFRGNSTQERVLGVVTTVGDLASFGLGSKIQAVRKGAGIVVLSAASVRLSFAAEKAAAGTANFATGIDASLAILESALVGVTFVKLRVPPLGGVARVEGPEAAKIMARLTGQYEDDILRAGISDEVLESLGISIRNLVKNVDNQVTNLFSPQDVEFLETALIQGDFQNPRLLQFFDGIARSRGRPVLEKEKPVAILFEIAAQKLSQRTGRGYAEALNEIFRFDVLFAGNNTAAALRIPKNGSAKPVAIHRIIGELIQNSPGSRYPASVQEIRELMISLGYYDLDQHTAILERIVFYLRDFLPSAPNQVTKLHSVENLSGRTGGSLDDIIQSYLSKGTISSGVDAGDVVQKFLPGNAEKAILIEFVPSSGGSKVTPISGYGDLADITDTLQRGRGYDGAVPGEVVIVTPPGQGYRIIGAPRTSFRGATEIINVAVELL